MTVWERVKSQLRIEDVISDYVQVKQKGHNFTCLCPFHKEKTPSLIISTEKQIWHCFGCGLGGDAFAFVSLIENMDKKQTLEKLAKRAGVKLESSIHKNPGDSRDSQNNHSGKNDNANLHNNYQQGLTLLEWSSELYHQLLLKALKDPNNPVTQYCLQRGLTPEIIKKFKLGLAPGNNILAQKLKDSKENLDLATQIGLLK